MSSARLPKRTFDHDAPISPPPLRRKIQSTTTKTAVASFFTPTSQKPAERITWQERSSADDTPTTLLVGKFDPEKGEHEILDGPKKVKIAAFDFDSTLIQTSSGKKFASDASDWKWFHPSVPDRVRKLYRAEGFKIVIISNQGGISLHTAPKGPKAPNTKVNTFKIKASAVLAQLDIPMSIYAATAKDIYRKPRIGMWSELLTDLEIHNPEEELDLPNSIFVGDAGGRVASLNTAGKKIPGDFSCSDRNFADNVGLNFQTPEEFFLEEEPRPFARPFDPLQHVKEATQAEHKYQKNNPQDIVLLCGSPGSGKSTFYWKKLEPLGYMRINQDILKTREKCFKVAGEYLDKGMSVAVDNTNADPQVRYQWIQLATKHSIPIRCIHLTATTEVCEHNDAVRSLNSEMNPEKRIVLPTIAFRSFTSRYRKPDIKEGFQDVTEVDFKFEGTEAEKDIWGRYWT